MAFKLRQDVQEVQTRRILLAASITVKIGDIIKNVSATSTATATNASMTGAIFPLGVVVGFSKSNGEVISTGTDPANTPGSLTTISTNVTVDKYNAVFIPFSPNQEYRGTLSATAGTTTGSDQPYTWFGLSDCRTIDETTVLAAADGSAPLVLLSLGVDPEDTTSKTLIVKVAKSIMYQP